MLTVSFHNLAAMPAFIAFASVLAGSLGVPVPSLAAVIFVGSVLAKHPGGATAIGSVFVSAVLAAALGDLALFMIGRRYGIRVTGLICRLSLSRDSCVRQTSGMFARRGIKILLFARFVPGLSVLAAPLAAISGIGLARFLLFAEIGAAIWIGVGLGLGLVFAAQIDAVLLWLERVGMGLGAVGVVIVLAFAGISLFRRHRLLRQLRVARITIEELVVLLQANPAPTIIDARGAVERVADPFIIPGAVTCVDQSAVASLGAATRGAVVIYCSCPNEISAAHLAKRFRDRGYANVRPLLGGMDAWRKAGHPVHSLSMTQDVALEAFAAASLTAA